MPPVSKGSGVSRGGVSVSKGDSVSGANVSFVVEASGPSASGDSGSGYEDDVDTVDGNLLTNDTGDSLTVASIESETDDTQDITGTYGTLDWDSDGSFSYTIDNGNGDVQALAVGETLQDEFTYIVEDGDENTDSATLTITINGTNDAPTMAGSGAGSANFTGITEDEINNSGDLVSTLLGTSLTDTDTSDSEGIAITSVGSSNGAFEYSTNAGSSWSAIGSVATNNALLLRAIDKVRFVPDQANAETATITYYGWDQSTGTAGTKVDATTTGDATPFSTGFDTASITVSDVNDAPVLGEGTANFSSITEDQTTNSGDIVSDLINSQITDSDSGASEGIAVYSTSEGNGVFEYSTNAGSSWTEVGTVSGSSALLLRSIDYLRYVPDAENADSASLMFRAWDQTSGTQGTKVDVSTNGGTTPYSAETATASITVAAVNDAPVVGAGGNDFTGITEDDTDSSGDLVSSILNTSVSDVDSGAVEGLAVTSTTESNGHFEYSTNAGSSWTDISTVSGSSSLLLRAEDKIRFIPDGENSDSASLTYRAWDQSSGTYGTKVDTSTNGTTTPYSSSTDSATITVSAVNDAPIMAASGAGSADFSGIDYDETGNSGELVSTLLGTSVSDVDTSASEGIAVYSTTETYGHFEYSTNGGSSWTDISTVSGSSALLLRAIDKVRFEPDGANTETASISYRAWDQTSGTQGTKVDVSTNGGSTAFSTGTDDAEIIVSAPSAADTFLLNTGDNILLNTGDLVLRN